MMLRTPEEHVAGAIILFGYAVDAQAHPQLLWVGYLVGGDDPGAHRAIAVDALALEALLCRLWISRAETSFRTVFAEDVRKRIRLANIFTGIANDYGQLDFPVDFVETAGSITILP